MPNFFLTDANGQKHSLTQQQLQALATTGRITPTTPLESDTGHRGVAGQIPTLKFNIAAPQSVPVPATGKNEHLSKSTIVAGSIVIASFVFLLFAVIIAGRTTTPAPVAPAEQVANERVVEPVQPVRDNVQAPPKTAIRRVAVFMAHYYMDREGGTYELWINDKQIDSIISTGRTQSFRDVEVPTGRIKIEGRVKFQNAFGAVLEEKRETKHVTIPETGNIDIIRLDL